MLIHSPGSVPNECRLHDNISRKVYILKVTPTITPELIRAVCENFDGKCLGLGDVYFIIAFYIML